MLLKVYFKKIHFFTFVDLEKALNIIPHSKEVKDMLSKARDMRDKQKLEKPKQKVSLKIRLRVNLKKKSKRMIIDEVDEVLGEQRVESVKPQEKIEKLDQKDKDEIDKKDKVLEFITPGASVITF